MQTVKKAIVLILLIQSLLMLNTLVAQDSEDGKGIELKKTSGRIDDGYGRLNKGELINIIGNYGTISDSYLQNVIYNFTWPKSRGAETSDAGSEDATDDFSIMFATSSVKNVQGSGIVIDGHTNFDSEDWRGVDGASGHYHCALDEQRDYLLAPDGTPMLATSDLPETWPAGWMDDDDQWPGIWHPGPSGSYNSLSPEDKAMVDSLAGWYDPIYDVWRFWPGKFRIDLQTGERVPGEFAADRHVWCIMDDEDNLQGPRAGIVVEMEALSYGRPYAEDFHFYNFTIRNISSSQLDSCYWGYYIDPKFGDTREEELYAYNMGINPNDKLNAFIQYDPTGQTIPDRWREIGVIGLGVLESPKDVGVTVAHFNPDGGAQPVNDWELWALITGNPADPRAPQPISEYFHGPDPLVDDFSLSWGAPADYGFMLFSGPFSLAPGEKVKATLVVSAGSDQVELMADRSELETGDFANNLLTAYDMYLKSFQGPAGPPAPNLYGVPGDQKVTLYWDDIPEVKPDPFTGELDFEGYKIYRSVDAGATWGTAITDGLGQVVGYRPLAQFDTNNNVSGFDPVNVNNFLGSNTGIRHVFVDSTVSNGIEYTYSITAYDRGDPAFPIASFESSRGTSDIESNVIRVTPRSDPIGMQDPQIAIQTQAQGNGVLAVEIIAPPTEARTYQVTFTESPAQEFRVEREGIVLGIFDLNSDEDRPLVEGLRFRLNGDTSFGGIKGVVDEQNRSVFGAANPDTTGNWFVETAELVNGTTAPAEDQFLSFEIRFTSDSSWASKTGPDPQLADLKVPFSVWNISADPPVQTNALVSGNDLKFDYGDQIYIGTKPYTAQSAGDAITDDWRTDFPYRLILRSTPANSSSVLPLEGQTIRVTTNRGFSTTDQFKVTVQPAEAQISSSEFQNLLDEIRVVPNPYVVNAFWETQQNERRLRFMFLPGECTVSIYTISGELVTRLEHTNGTGDMDWNLLSSSGQEIAYGLYIYVIEAQDTGGKTYAHTGKFVVIK